MNNIQENESSENLNGNYSIKADIKGWEVVATTFIICCTVLGYVKLSGNKNDDIFLH